MVLRIRYIRKLQRVNGQRLHFHVSHIPFLLLIQTQPPHGAFLHGAHGSFVLFLHMVVAHQVKNRVRGQIAHLARHAVAVFLGLLARAEEIQHDVAQIRRAALRVIGAPQAGGHVLRGLPLGVGDFGKGQNVRLPIHAARFAVHAANGLAVHQRKRDAERPDALLLRAGLRHLLGERQKALRREAIFINQLDSVHLPASPAVSPAAFPPPFPAPSSFRPPAPPGSAFWESQPTDTRCARGTRR